MAGVGHLVPLGVEAPPGVGESARLVAADECDVLVVDPPLPAVEAVRARVRGRGRARARVRG